MYYAVTLAYLDLDVGRKLHLFLRTVASVEERQKKFQMVYMTPELHLHKYVIVNNSSDLFTCVSVRWREFENSARSAMLRYCFSRNFFSRFSSCCVVNGVLGFRLGLCFLRLHFSFGGSPLLESVGKKINVRLEYGRIV